MAVCIHAYMPVCIYTCVHVCVSCTCVSSSGETLLKQYTAKHLNVTKLMPYESYWSHI